MTASEDLIVSMNGQGYVYCAKHNIFYRKELEDEAQRKCGELKEKGYFGLALLVRACPLCKTDVVLPLLNLGGNRMPERTRISGKVCRDPLIEVRKR